MRVCAGALGLVLAVGAATPSWASKTQKIEELVALHELKSAVAIGDYYLRQQTVLAVRARLEALGKQRNLGPEWTPANPHFRAAEHAMLAAATRELNRQFSSREWLSEEWAALNDRDFSEVDVDSLLSHFRTEYGRKQVMIVDHGVAVHVQGALTFTGKRQYAFPGLESDRERMQKVYDDEDREMRFDIQDSPEGERFALSPIGKRYFVNAVLNVSGMISQRIDQTVAALPQMVQSLDARAELAIEAFRASHPG
jgi:hypothetical protein